jgi:hypothetical protein
MSIIFFQGCAMNQYQQAKINDNSYLITFDSGIRKSLQTKINSTLNLKPETSQDT